jgi:hypothetical protein
MAPKIVWDEISKRFYETGVDHGVLYVADPDTGTYPKGVAWNGLTTVTEKPSGAAAAPQYADNIKYLNLIGLEEFAASVAAFTYPDEFEACDGSEQVLVGVGLGQQVRSMFGLVYRSGIGNDVVGENLGYKLHLIYGCVAAPSQKAYATVNATPAPIDFSWEITTTPIPVSGHRPVSCLTIDSTKANATNLAALETILFGVAEVVAAPDATPPVTGVTAVEGRLPLPDEVITLMTPSGS